MHHRCTTCFDSRLALPILQAPPPTRATERRWGVYTSEKSAKIHLSQEALEAWRAEHGVAAKPAETDPTYGLMPATVDVVNNENMAAFLAMDGSGELLPAR